MKRFKPRTPGWKSIEENSTKKTLTSLKTNVGASKERSARNKKMVRTVLTIVCGITLIGWVVLRLIPQF